MKVVNEKGKLFGIINIVDLLVILFVLLVVGGVAWRLFGNQVQAAIAPTKEVTITTRYRPTFMRYYEGLSDYELPMQLLQGDGLIADAHLVEVRWEPYVTQTTTADGRIVDADDPTKIDIVFTIKAKINDAPSLKVGTQEVRIGRDYIVKTKYLELPSVVEKIEFAD